MVQEYQSLVRVYKHPFELIMAAYERRFPKCPQISVVLDCAMVEDAWTEDDSQRHTTRRCQLNVEAPYLLKKIIGVEYVYFIQKNSLNLRTRSLHIESTNDTFSSRVLVLEKCKYYVHPENPEWTCFEQTALLDVKNFFGIEHSIEKIAMKQYSANIAKGKEIIDVFIAQMQAEGVTTAGTWCEGCVVENRKLRALLCGRNATLLHATQTSHTPHTPHTPANTPSELTEAYCEQDKYQLDSEYIKRYLGELTVTQQSRLLQLRKWLAELQKGKVPNDTTLVRFLRARDFNVERAREMLSQSLLWRKKHSVDRILSEYETPQVVANYFPGGWHHHDKDGRPLYVLRLGQMDVKGLLKSIGEDGLLKLTLHVCEEGLNLMWEATRQGVGAVQGWCLLVDLEGLNMRHLWRPGVRALLRIIQCVECNYPETMGRVLVVRAPRVFPILWTIVTTFIDENTRSKFLFYSGKDYLYSPGGLGEYIPKDLIPDFLGGACKVDFVEAAFVVPQHFYIDFKDELSHDSFVHEGGLIPKNLYAGSAFMERSDGDPLSEDSIYQSVSLAKGQVHEVVLVNEDPQSVLTWDFDVVCQDVSFSVFRTHHKLASQTHTKTGLCVATGETEHHSVLDKEWQEGRHYHCVEPRVLCHDGESIQGSHVMTDLGSYVLQWRWSGASELLDFSGHHNAQLMYFYETLASHHYKGSMSSLQSGNSAFSSLSGKSVASSCPSR